MGKKIASPSTLAARVKDAAIAGIIAAALATPLIGFKTDQSQNNELMLTYRWHLVFLAAALVFFIKLAMNILAARQKAPSRTAQSHIEPSLWQTKLLSYLQRFSPCLGSRGRSSVFPWH